MLGSKRRAGTEHFIIRQLDRTLAPLPAWMAEPGQAALVIVGHPRFPVEGLADLRTLVDALMASCTGFRPLSRELAMKSARRKQGDLFEEIRVVELRPELRGRLTPLLPALLAAAARLEPRQTPPNGLGSVKASDHQDHG